MDTLVQFQGVVLDLISVLRNPTTPKVIFKLRTAENKDYKVECPFFCPLSIGDGFYGVGKILDSNNVLIVKPPFVSIPIDRDNTIQFFLKSLKGTKFGLVSATKLYQELESLAKQFHYGKEFEHEKTEAVYSGITHESRYHGDGVIAILTEYAAEYCNTKSEKIIEFFAGKSINKPQTKKLLEEWNNKRSFRRLFLLGLSRFEINGSNKSFDEMYNICLQNPYRIPSIQYDKCEKILSSIGRFPTDIQKDCGRINRYVYENSNSKGWICTPEWMVRKAFPKYDTYKEILQKEYELTELNENVYTVYNYKVESTVSNYINSLILETAEAYRSNIGPRLNRSYECKTLTDEQKNAIEGVLNSKVSIITGGAGVGKSLCIREITRNLSSRGVKFILAAFTGKAVSRLHEIMRNKVAATIDRHIRSGILDEPIQHIIIDESSMVTTELFYRMISKLKYRPAITFIGDCNQLPPIGAGTLMRELMNSRRIPIYYLTQNQRIVAMNQQSNEEKTEGVSPGQVQFDRFILENANALIDPKRNRRTPIKYKEGSGFYIMEGNKTTVESILSSLYQIKCDPDKIVIISPYKYPVKELNDIFQQVFYSDLMDTDQSYYQPTMDGGRLWCIGDRVMMTVNNYKINVMNGEQGKVVSIEDEGIRVQFEDEVQHLFKFSSGKNPEEEDLEMDDIDENSGSIELIVDFLIHSYALTTHRSQGSEYEYVILYIPEDKKLTDFLNINLLYTAITRTKKTIWVVSSKYNLEKISTVEMPKRYDGLALNLQNMRIEAKEKILEPYIRKPEILTGTHLSTTLTEFVEEIETAEDIYALYE